MEKVGALISRLQQQFSHQADETSLLNTALMLVAELQKSKENAPAPGKVTVITPYKPFEIIAEDNNITVPATDERKEPETLPVVEEEAPVAAAEEPEQTELSTTQEEPAEETITPSAPQESLSNPAVQTTEPDNFNVVEEVPTLIQQQPKVVYQLHDNTPAEELSINDKLKAHAPETVSKLQAEPIKDLRKAIGINDKYLFIKELFRNDETAYERSIKTINNFNVLQEAEYWMQREMKYKLGWDDNNPTVMAFYQLVKRRFS